MAIQMILHDSIRVAATPADVVRFFDEMDESRYLAWHPDHVAFAWVRGRGARVGNIFRFEERIAGKLLRKRVVFTKIDPNGHVEFAPTFWLMRLFLPRMIFRAEPEAEGCRFIAEVHLRMGPLAAWLHRKEFAAVREHMRVESLNLQRFFERAQAATAALDADPDGNRG